ncbi:MAG: S-methyl-5-thioribose-1-phosphate isomerase [Phycisphaerae bacterium]
MSPAMIIQNPSLHRTPKRYERGPLSTFPPTVAWDGGRDGVLQLLDQTVLPATVTSRRCESAEHVWQAIKELCVRGAPAIGVAGAYGLCLGTRDASQKKDRSETGPPAQRSAEFVAHVEKIAAYLITSRPTAVNLAWAVRRVADLAARVSRENAPDATWDAMLLECHAICDEDAEACRRIGQHGAALIPENGGVLTHCNAGALATVAYGTALAPMYVAQEMGRKFRVFADETRPLLQGSRLTAFELATGGVNVSILCDNAAASLMRQGHIQMCIVGADRIAANGDTANKIGTYSVALAAKAHGIPFYVAAPRSTFDLSIASGDAIPIEQRSADEVRGGFLREGVTANVPCVNPAFDVTPAELIAGIVTELGVIRPVTAQSILATLGG